MQAWYFATPIFWPITMVAAMSERAAQLMMLNPMAQMMQDARYVLVNQEYMPTVWSMIGNPFIASIPVVIVFAVLIFSVKYFRKASKRFAEQI